MDTLLGKLEGGQMTMIAGRPGMGKSTLGVSASARLRAQRAPGLYALCESSAEMFSIKMTRTCCTPPAGRVLFKTLKEGDPVEGEERADLARAREVAKMLPIKWAHIGRTDVKRLEAIVARESMRG
jgi:replicative DNA helicase